MLWNIGTMTRKVTTTRPEIIDSSLQRLLSSLPPEVATKVHEKWEEDRASFLKAFLAKYGDRSIYSWAKPSCKHCYGRGFVGTVGDGVKIPCRCTRPNYFKALQAFRTEYNTTVRDTENENVSEHQSA